MYIDTFQKVFFFHPTLHVENNTSISSHVYGYRCIAKSSYIFNFPTQNVKTSLKWRLSQSHGEWVICIHASVEHQTGKCLLLCQEDVPGQVSPTAGRVSREIEEGGGGRGIKMTYGSEWAATEIMSEYPHTQDLHFYKSPVYSMCVKCCCKIHI